MIEKGFYRNILRLSLPAAFQALISLLIVMVDNLMVSSLDTQGLSLAAVSQSNSITNFVNAALMGLAGGSVVLISQYWGKRETQRIKPVGATVLSLCFGFAAVIVLLLNFFPSHILNLVIAKKETGISSLALNYLPILSLSYLPLAISAALIAILKGVEVVRVTLFATAVSLFSNIGFNYLLIFGKLGLPALGVRGAAIATVLARLIEVSVVSYYFFRVQTTIRFKPRELLHHRAWAWTDYARFGLPVGLTDAQWALIGMLKMVIIGQLGRIMINAVAVTDMLLNLGTLFTFALAGGAAVVVGKAVGTEDYDYVRAISKKIQMMFLFIGVVMASLVFFIRDPFISLYGLDGQIATQASLMVAVTAFTLLGTTYHASCFVGINRGAGDSRFVMMVDMICGWLIVLPAAFLSAFVLKLPFHWIYFSTRIDQSFKWIIAFFRLRGDKWIHNVTRDEAV